MDEDGLVVSIFLLVMRCHALMHTLLLTWTIMHFLDADVPPCGCIFYAMINTWKPAFP